MTETFSSHARKTLKFACMTPQIPINGNTTRLLFTRMDNGRSQMLRLAQIIGFSHTAQFEVSSVLLLQIQQKAMTRCFWISLTQAIEVVDDDSMGAIAILEYVVR